MYICQVERSFQFRRAEGVKIESDGPGDPDPAHFESAQTTNQPGGLSPGGPRSQEQKYKGAAGPGRGVAEEAHRHGGQAEGSECPREDQRRGKSSKHRRVEADYFKSGIPSE